jgi:hypothetical protein
MKTSCLLVAGFAVLSLTSAHAAFDPAIVPADSRWVLYADLENLRNSTLGKELTALLEKQQLANLPIGVDPQKLLATIGSATAYGANFSANPQALDGTLVVRGTPDLRKIVESVLLQATIASPEQVSEFTELPFPAYAIKSRPPAAPKKDDGVPLESAPKQISSAAKMELIVAFPPEPVVLASKSKAQIVRAEEVLRGGGSSLARTPSSPLARFASDSANAFFFASSVVPSDQLMPAGVDNSQARILKMTNSGSVALGETGPNTFARVQLIATSDEMADKLTKILQGMTAMLSLAETTDRQLGEFLSATSVTRDGDAVRLALSYPSARLVQMLQNLKQMQQPPAPAVANQAPPITNGNTVAEWTSEPGPNAGGPASLAWHTIDNVTLQNGSTITLGRTLEGGRSARFDRVEIVPQGGGAPLVFRSNYMRITGPRGSMVQFVFPGMDGLYTLKVAYYDDPQGKARYAVSVREPRAVPPPPPAPAPVAK